MQEKYGKEGLAAVSVSLDDASDQDARAKVLKFLEGKKARFSNFILDEKPEVWQEKLDIGGPPCVLVFGRDGKLVKNFNDGVDYQEVEKLAVEQLKK